jgi:iduronate 2-sulfatase
VALSRRQFLGAMAAAPLLQGAPKRPNVFFIAVDDLRPDLGCYGNRVVRSPNIDRLARSSLVFDHAYCQQAVCCPSRTSLLTGLRPDSNKVWDNATHFRDTVPDVITLPEHFKQSGYFTQALGKIYHGRTADRRSWTNPAWPPGGQQAGMQYVDIDKLPVAEGAEIPTLTWKKRESWQSPDVPDNALQDGQTADRAVAAMQGFEGQPFFLAVGFQKPHLPFTAPKKYFNLYSRQDLETAANPRRPDGAPDVAFTGWEELRGYIDIPNEGPLPEGKALELAHGYLAATSYMDAQVGRVLAELDRLKLRDNTVVILWGDHGYHLGEHDLWCKATNFELDTRCPLMLQTPGMRFDGYRTGALVELVDIYPTLADVCDLAVPVDCEGTSMMPLLANPLRPWKKAAFSQFRRPWPGKGDWEHMGYSVRSRTHRYTEWRRLDGSVTAQELYDHRTDGAETMNVATEQPEVVTKLSQLLRASWRAAQPEGATQ